MQGERWTPDRHTCLSLTGDQPYARLWSIWSRCHSLILETLKDILHVVPLSLQPGLITVHYIQLPA